MVGPSLDNSAPRYKEQERVKVTASHVFNLGNKIVFAATGLEAGWALKPDWQLYRVRKYPSLPRTKPSTRTLYSAEPNRYTE